MSDVLTLEQVNDLLNGQRTRGDYKPVIRTFAESGEVYINLSDKFPGKKPTAIMQSVKLNIDKLRITDNVELPELVCTLSPDKAKVFLLNKSAYDAAKAEAEAEAQ